MSSVNYKQKYEHKLVKILVRLNPDVDSDIIDFIKTVDNKQGLLKKLLREEIERNKENNKQ